MLSYCIWKRRQSTSNLTNFSYRDRRISKSGDSPNTQYINAALEGNTTMLVSIVRGADQPSWRDVCGVPGK